MSEKAKAADAAGCESPPTESGGDSTQSAEKQIEHLFQKYLPDMNPADFPKVHPHANIFPMISMEEMQVLADDIKANGLKHEIAVMHILDDFGQDELWILEGRNRWVACTLAGVTPRFIDETLKMTNSEKESATLDYVISENLARRHLSGTQRDVIAERLATAKRGGKQNGEFTIEQAAKQLKRSASSLHKVRKLKEKAREIYDALSRGEYKNVDAAWKAAGLGVRVPRKYFVKQGGNRVWGVHHEKVDSPNMKGCTPFDIREEAQAEADKQNIAAAEAKAKAEAEAKAAEAEAERQKAEAEAQAEQLQSEQSQPEAAQPESNNQTDADQPEQAQPEPTAAPAEEEPMVDLTLLPQQQLVELACRVVYPEGAPEPDSESMRDFLAYVRQRDARYPESHPDFKETFKTIQELLEYAAGAKKKRLLDERLVNWLKLMAVKFTVRMLHNQQLWVKSMLNLSYAGK